MREGGRQTMFEKFIELYIYFLLFPFSIYNPQQDKRKNMNLQWISKASCPNVERIENRNGKDTTELSIIS
jgi:hypothetical protein